MTAHSFATRPPYDPTAVAAQIAAIEACLGHSGGDVGAGDAPIVEFLSDWSSDRAAEKWENETRRCWP